MLKKLTARRNCIGMATDEIVEAVLDDRGIDDIQEWLHPSEDCLIPFDKMKGLQEAYELIDDGIAMGERFLLLADIDQDGVSCAAIMERYLKRCGANIRTVINKGKKHGCEDFDLSLLDGIDIFIVVDSLNNNPEIYRKIAEKSKLCIFDHHIAQSELLNSDVPFILVSSAVDYPNPALSGSGVCLKFALFCDEMNLTDYVNEENLWLYGGLGIVSDMCDLSSEENRYIVSRALSNYNNPVIKKMVGTYMFDSQSISFSIAPLINSAMRMSENELALNVWLTDNEDEIDSLVRQLKKCRENQNKIVDSMIDGLLAQGEQQLDKKAMFFFADTDEGELLGLLANRLLSVYQRPLFVIRDNGDQYTGSMRATGISDMLKIVNDTSLATCQGHELASGFMVDKDKFEDFKRVIENILKDVKFTCDITADIEIEPSQVTEDLIKRLTVINRISGSGFPPITVLMRTSAYRVETFSTKKHLKVVDSVTNVLFVKWNDMAWETMNNDGEFIGIGVLSHPWYGKKQFIQLTLNEYTKQNN